MKLISTTIVIALAFIVVAAPALAASNEAIILLDASWSMNGFYKASSICEIVDDIRNSLTGASFGIHSLIFKDQDPPFPFTDCNHVDADGKITLIDLAYENALKRQPKVSVVWLITDNVQDPNPNPSQPNPENDDIRKFYNVLEQDRRVSRVYVFIRTPAFAGPIYQKDGKSLLSDHYAGKRGLLIYGILLDPAVEAEFEKTIRLFSERSRGKVAANMTEGTPVKGFSNRSVNTRIKADNAPHLRVRESDNALVFQKVFREQEPIQGTFHISFISGPPNLAIDKPVVDVSSQEQFYLFVGDAKFSAEVPDVSAAPSKLNYPLLPAAGGSSTQQTGIQINVRFPQGVTFPHSPRYLWNYLWQHHAAVYRGTIKVGVQAPVRDIGMTPDILDSYDIGDDYFTRPTEDAQQRIYGLRYLFQQLHSREARPITIPATAIPVEFSVIPPRWPVAVLLLLAVILAGMTAMLAKTLSGRQFQLEPVGLHSFRLASGRNTSSVARPGRRGIDLDVFAAHDSSTADLKKSVRLGFLGSHTIVDENERLGELRRKLSGIAVIAAPGYVVNGSPELRLSGRGGTFTFQKPATDEANHDGFSKQDVPERGSGARRSRSRSESGSFFDS